MFNSIMNQFGDVFKKKELFKPKNDNKNTLPSIPIPEEWNKLLVPKQILKK